MVNVSGLVLGQPAGERKEGSGGQGICNVVRPVSFSVVVFVFFETERERESRVCWPLID